WTRHLVRRQTTCSSVNSPHTVSFCNLNKLLTKLQYTEFAYIQSLFNPKHRKLSLLGSCYLPSPRPISCLISGVKSSPSSSRYVMVIPEVLLVNHLRPFQVRKFPLLTCQHNEGLDSVHP